MRFETKKSSRFRSTSFGSIEIKGLLNGSSISSRNWRLNKLNKEEPWNGS